MYVEHLCCIYVNCRGPKLSAFSGGSNPGAGKFWFESIVVSCGVWVCFCSLVPSFVIGLFFRFFAFVTCSWPLALIPCERSHRLASHSSICNQLLSLESSEEWVITNKLQSGELVFETQREGIWLCERCGCSVATLHTRQEPRDCRSHVGPSHWHVLWLLLCPVSWCSIPGWSVLGSTSVQSFFTGPPKDCPWLSR